MNIKLYTYYFGQVYVNLNKTICIVFKGVIPNYLFIFLTILHRIIPIRIIKPNIHILLSTASLKKQLKASFDPERT